MRITIVIGGLGGGGAERVCVNLANAWATRWEVTLLTITQRSAASTYALDGRVSRCDVGWPRALHAHENGDAILLALRDAQCLELAGEVPLMAALRTSIVDTAPDVVVSHMDLTSVRVIAALHGTGIPVVACEHTDPRRVPLGPWQRAREVLYRRAKDVVASHAKTTEWLTQRGIRARTIPNALVPPALNDARLPSPEATPAKRKTLVTLGRLAPEKRVELLVRAFARIAGDLPEWDLAIYGDGPLREALQRVIDANGLNGRAVLKGFTDDPYGALSNADLYVSTSAVEGFGNAIWEALACGVPVIAMDCGAPVRTLVREGIDGRIVIGSEHALSVALAELMGDDEARNALAARAGEAAGRYPLEAVLRQWEAVLT
jgi:GalNAc-alpha-(1->4)-GalNAc-alpha-(1->3)-diNAcBac-PP-undecaprenol alpha-1,4-N-acetyl-D-galactosaminyltransferase